MLSAGISTTPPSRKGSRSSEPDCGRYQLSSESEIARISHEEEPCQGIR
jgi:hypothetical protein